MFGLFRIAGFSNGAKGTNGSSFDVMISVGNRISDATTDALDRA